MPLPIQPHGVRKVSESITQDGRALIITEEDDSKLDWGQIPDGTLKINPKNGLMSVKLEGETDWIPAGLENDGEICIARDSKMAQESFTIITLNNGDGTFTYENATGNRRVKALTLEGHHLFELEQGNFMPYRNLLEVTLDDVVTRTPESGGVIEMDEHRFLLTEELFKGMKVTARYIKVFRIGNPYPRFFINTVQPGPQDGDYGDFWLDTDATVENEMALPEEPIPTKVRWDEIEGKPTTLSGYEIQDDVSYDGHNHKTSEIVDFPSSLPAKGGDSDSVRGMSPAGQGASKLLTTGVDGKISTSVIPTYINNSRMTISASSPPSPIANQEIWFDTGSGLVKWFDGTGWKLFGAGYL